MTERVPLRVALVGYGFMGAAHSQGWRVAPRFFELPLAPQMKLIVVPFISRTGSTIETPR